MSDDIDPHAPCTRLRVLAKTLERIIPHVRADILFVDRGDAPTGVTTTTDELNKVRAEIDRIANEMDPLS